MQTMFSGQWGRWQQVFVGLALILVVLHFFIYVYYSFSLMQFPFDYDQGEGFELNDTLYLSEGKSPYRNNETWPFYASNYPPIYHVVLIPFVWIFGPEYWYGRLVAFLSTLVTAGTIGFAVYRDGGRRREIAALMGFAFLASNYIYHIGPLFRQHYFMVMFEVLAVVTLANALERPQQRQRLLLGMGLLLIAGYTKQLAAYTCAAVFLWLFIRNPRRSIVYSLGLGAAAGLIFLILNIITEGQWYTNIVAANVNQFIMSQFTGLLKQYVRLHWPILLLAGLLTVYELYFARLSIYAVWFVVATISTIGAGKWGAGDSYFATSLAAACILAGIFISRTLNQTWVFPENYLSRPFLNMTFSPGLKQSLGMLCLILMIIYGVTVVKMPTSGAVFEPISQALGFEPAPGHRYPLYDAAGWTPGYATIGHLTSQEDEDSGWKIVDRIRASDLPVLSEEAGFSLQAEREVISNPTQLLNLYENDLFDPKNLIAVIESQGFGLIIFRAQFYPEPVLSAIYDAYIPQEVIPMNGFNYELWIPASDWETRRDIRDYLNKNPAEALEVAIPAEIEDHRSWMFSMMDRWGWTPVIALEAAPSTECESREFIRLAQRIEIRLCGDKLIFQP